MRPAFLADTIRAAEADLMARLPEGALMQRAAAALAAVVFGELRSRTGRVAGARVLVVAGGGNNGGDALFLGARLLARGAVVRCWRVAGAAHASAWQAFTAAGGRELDAVAAIAWLGEADLVVDGVLGIGGRAGLAGPVALFARGCADADVPVVAVDLPSGLNADLPNRPAPVCFTAAVSVTFGGFRLCHVLEPARSACGRVEVVDIGLDWFPPDLVCWDPADVAAVWPFPQASSDKYSRGVVGIDAGSPRYPGAGVLATLGAIHAGPGMVRFVGHATVGDLVRRAAPNVVFGDGQVQARVLGCGWGSDPEPASARHLDEAIGSGLPTIVDADGLRLLSEDRLGAQVLLTPHAGELARLLDGSRAEVEADPVAAVRAASAAYGCTVLLKGASQYVARPDDPLVSIAVPGVSWTAQAGSGDVLAGICGTLLAAGLRADRAALAGASIQALAASALPGPVPPQDVARAVPAAIAGLRDAGR